MSVDDIPPLNATLNGISAAFMTLGFFFIKQGKVTAHRACMMSASVVSALFLVSYVTHKVLIHGMNTPFLGVGVVRPVYYTMLVSHIILAISIAFLVPRTLLFALQGRFDRHRAWARWTFPIWYYVSVTGVLIYFFLYRWWPAVPINRVTG